MQFITYLCLFSFIIRTLANVHHHNTEMFLLLQMYTRKRKTNSNNEDHRKKTKRENLITHVKAVQVGRKGNFHYFGKCSPSQVEERLDISWLDNNCMQRSWRRSNLRGKNGKKLGTWCELPLGSKNGGKIPSRNPCVAGTEYFIIIS